MEKGKVERYLQGFAATGELTRTDFLVVRVQRRWRSRRRRPVENSSPLSLQRMRARHGAVRYFSKSTLLLPGLDVVIKGMVVQLGLQNSIAPVR
eukprot:COSAG02_NODE_25050_length_670_cov_0.812609_2_plen_94_part_00